MASFGETLRRERELRRIPLREVSEATKINIRYLEALERNEFTYLPGGAFTRGFIRAFCRYVGVDETEMLNAYLYEVGHQQTSVVETQKDPAVDNLREHFRVEYGADEKRRRRLRVAVLAGAGLLVLALLAGGSWWLWQRSHQLRYEAPYAGDSRPRT